VGHWGLILYYKYICVMDAVESSSSSDELQLTVNTSYASKYDRWRSKEEYQKRVWSLLLFRRVRINYAPATPAAPPVYEPCTGHIGRVSLIAGVPSKQKNRMNVRREFCLRKKNILATVLECTVHQFHKNLNWKFGVMEGSETADLTGIGDRSVHESSWL